MTAEIQPMGQYRASTTGSAVIGLEGAFDPPFLSLGQTNVHMSAFCTYVTNQAETVTNVTEAFLLSNAKVVGRHRYLDQMVGPWQVADMAVDGGTLTTTAGFDVPARTGDWEFYFTADQKAPHYQIVDYTTGATNNAAYGAGWTDGITNIVCRASYGFALPSGGTDWFSRIREGQSAYKYVNLVGQVTTNGVWGEDMHAVAGNERLAMELVGDHTWRYHYFVPTNRVGETLRFHFEGVGLVTNATPFVYLEQTNTWYATATNVPYLPYTAVANGHVEAHVTLDMASTHLLIEFNDAVGSFSIAHATYQNFNMWTDALNGFRGDYVTTTGVSIAKAKYAADLRSWPETTYVRPTVWRETFDVPDNDTRYPLGQYGQSWSSPNGWSLQNGEFVMGRRTSPHGYAFQMQGMGLGSFSLDKVGADAVPRGIGTISFTARVAQAPAFNDFVYYFDGGAFRNYAFSAKVTMSRLYDSKFSPLDISPANPTLSLVGYYHPGKGCYEFRLVRSGENALTAQLWKWRPNGEPTCLATNVLNRTGNGQPGPDQKPVNNFYNLLVPGTSAKLNDWSNAYISLYTADDSSQTTICCYLAGGDANAAHQNSNTVANDVTHLKEVLRVVDQNAPLTRGTFGVGSTDCRAGFKYLQKHEMTSATEINKTGDPNFGSIWNDSDWTYVNGESARWETMAYTMGTLSGYGIGARVPTNQTVKVCFAKQGEKDNAWIESGHEVVVQSFSTNMFTVSPCVPADYLVQLRTGGTTDDERTDVVIDYVDVTAWRGEDLPNMSSMRAFPEDWVYTMGSIETAIEVTGGTYDVVEVDGEGFAYVFTTNGNVTGQFTLKPRLDVVLDRILVVGGDGRVQDVSQTRALTTNTTITVKVARTEAAASDATGKNPGFTVSSAGAPTGLSSDITGKEVLYGAEGDAEPRVIVRLKSNAKVCVLQPTRNYPPDDLDWPDKPMSVRSPFLENGLSLFSFSYRDADTNAVLHLQICTNLYSSGEMYTPSFSGPSDTEYWTTVATFAFSNMTAEACAEGTLTYFQSLRGPDHKGVMRLVVDADVMAHAQMQPLATRDLAYGRITITGVHCYDEPPLDERSWWGWNLHTEGWDGGNRPGTWAYLTDSPDGLSCTLNFSALASENELADPATYGIGLGEPGKASGNPNEYAKNNPFVQSPVLENGIGTVSFRARTFETNAVHPSVVILYGTAYPNAYQPNAVEGEAWKRLAEFVVSNNTYTTYTWKAPDDGKNTRAIRLEVGGARFGRRAKDQWQAWETPSNMPASVSYAPIERVVLDEVTAAEPVIPRLAFRDVRPFRSGLSSDNREPIANVTHMNEQPLIAESWGVQVRVEPQQMGDELDRESIEVWLAYYVCTGDVRTAKWGYKQWLDDPACVRAPLTCVDRTNLVFRSTYASAASVVPPVERPNTVVQYHVWATYRNTEGLAQPDHHLDATEWARPAWYWPIDYNATYGGNLEDNFSAYTILDSISPRRAWINEVNYNEIGTDQNTAQFFELAVPQGADLSQWYVRLTSYTLYQYPIAEFGISEGLQHVTAKTGTPLDGNYTNHYTLVSVRSPAAQAAGQLNAPASDGEWRRLTGALASNLDVTDNLLRNSASYGLELVRPSGIVEHQVVLQGTNLYAGTIFELAGNGTNLLNQVKAKDGTDATWFFAGEELKGSTLGVWTGHGEEGTWTNRLRATPGRINELADGTKQVFGDWFLAPNGTNVWVYAQVTDDHIWQYFNGNAANSNRSAVIIVPKGTTTNIQYVVDAWHEPGVCYVNDPSNPVTLAPRAGLKRHYQVTLNDIQDTVNVYAGTKPDARLAAPPYNLDPNDPYTPAILDWLGQWDDRGETSLGLYPTWYCWPTVNDKISQLSLRDMYWFDIPPAEDGWKIIMGMGGRTSGKPAVTPREVEVNGRPYSNVYVRVTLVLTNDVTHARRTPTLQSMSGHSSRDDFATMTSRWDGVTFKVTGQLQVRDPATGALVNTSYLPLRWFVFGEGSFDANGEAEIEIRDPHLENTPGYNYGWSAYYGTPVFYKCAVDEIPSGVYTTEMLTSNAVYETSSP